MSQHVQLRVNEPMSDFADQNLFEMFIANGAQLGFWLRRTTWANSCARVTSVGPLAGTPPYYGNPKVHADIYDLTTGELREANARLPAAGTYKTWRMINPPPWAADLETGDGR
jgi:hypothetical protein